MELKSFRVEKLHGVYDFELKFQNNTLILVGENGSGKSTLMKMLFYVLSCQWSKLAEFNFVSLSITMYEQLIVIPKYYIDFSDETKLQQLLPWQLSQYLRGKVHYSLEDINYICKGIGFPYGKALSVLNEIANRKHELRNVTELIRRIVGSTHILYIPTYRRMEVPIKDLVTDRNQYDYDRLLDGIEKIEKTEFYTELVGFGGMRDVKECIERACVLQKNTFIERQRQLAANIFKTHVYKEFKNLNYSHIDRMTEEQILSVLGRLDEQFLTAEEKKKLAKHLFDIKGKGRQQESYKQLYFYFDQFLKITKETEKDEENIVHFADICNKYIANKKIIYKKSDFDLSFYVREEKLSLDKLSSGEKQIVSLFAHMYLDEEKKYLVFIDEPELSLSIKWQKMFLEDMKNGPFCEGLFAVTHSPFIFENSLDKYAHGMSEFKENK